MRYKRWANELIYASVAELPAEALDAPRSIVFGSLLRTLNHTCAMDLVWQAHLQGRDHGLTTRNPADCPGFDEVFERQRELDDWYVTYADSLAKTAEDEIVDFAFIGGGQGSMSRRDILLHVVNHGTYHRGNVTAILYDCDVNPPTTDYPVFIRQQAVANAG